jgi:quercetin dioxygenase-like cupin family protein
MMRVKVVNVTACEHVLGQGYRRISIFNGLNTGNDQITLEYVILPKGEESTPHAHVDSHTVVFTLNG